MHSDDPGGVPPENEQQPEPDRQSSTASPNASPASNEKQPERAQQNSTTSKSALPSSAFPGVAATLMKASQQLARDQWVDRQMREEMERKRANDIRLQADGPSSELAEANKTHEAQLAAVETSVAARKAGLHPELVTGWEQVEIAFISDERVFVIAGSSRKTLNYAEFGCEDSRSHKPNLAWITLKTPAEQRGIIKEATGRQRNWPRVEKRMQEIRKVLRKHFGLDSDPLPFIRHMGYRARFKISMRPSSKS